MSAMLQQLHGPSTVAADQPAPASLSEKAYYLIRDRIVTLALEPGSMLNEKELTQELGLGRTPVREALKRLALENLVEVYPRRGIFVSSVDIRDLGSISELRAELEGCAARLAAERATPEERTMCEELITELDHLSDGAGTYELIDLDQRIHRHVYRCTHNPFLRAALEEHFLLTLRLWFLVLERVTRLEAAVQEHRQLLRAVAQQDSDRAEEVIRAHITGFEEAIRRVL
jgi:DNA-binding GntR family transcriptional regulator